MRDPVDSLLYGKACKSPRNRRDFMRSVREFLPEGEPDFFYRPAPAGRNREERSVEDVETHVRLAGGEIHSLGFERKHATGVSQPPQAR